MLLPKNDTSVWLFWPDFIYELAESIQAFPNVPPLYLVGGAVRDAYLRADITDLDIAVDGDAVAVARGVTDAWKADIYVMDRERGVARVFVKLGDSTVTIDFAKLRGPTLEDDLRDRDFTLNAMAADLLGVAGALIDPLRGVIDLRKKTLRRCSPRSISDDPDSCIACGTRECAIRPEDSSGHRDGYPTICRRVAPVIARTHP